MLWDTWLWYSSSGLSSPWVWRRGRHQSVMKPVSASAENLSFLSARYSFRSRFAAAKLSLCPPPHPSHSPSLSLSLSLCTTENIATCVLFVGGVGGVENGVSYGWGGRGSGGACSLHYANYTTSVYTPAPFWNEIRALNRCRYADLSRLCSFVYILMWRLSGRVVVDALPRAGAGGGGYVYKLQPSAYFLYSRQNQVKKVFLTSRILLF